MSTTPKITMIGLYNHDGTLFDDMQLPPEIDKELFVDSFLLNYGEFPVIYTNWGIMKFAIGVWSKKWYDSIQRIILAMSEEYDPLHNFDRYEEYTDVEGKKGTTTENRKTSEDLNEDSDRSINTYADGSTNQETENTVSAYNEDGYQPDNKEDMTSNTTNNSNSEEESSRSAKRSGTDDASGTSSEDRNLKHVGHLYGNIGVTQSTQMLNAELELRTAQNIIDIVAEMLYKEVCVYVL